MGVGKSTQWIQVPFQIEGSATSRQQRTFTNKGTTCYVDGCEGNAMSRSMCTKHYARWQTHGDPNIVLDTAIDLTGKRFGHLSVVKFLRVDNKKRIWLCECDCGGTTEVPTLKLRSNRTRSCGCKNGLPVQTHIQARIYAIYKRNAADRNFEFNLTESEFGLMTEGDCYYCGQSPNTPISSVRGQRLYNGVDRVDSSRGYVPDNCVSCCQTCNRMKGQLSYENFLRMAERIFIHTMVNGRSGSLLFNWLSGTIRNPSNPPDFWSDRP